MLQILTIHNHYVRAMVQGALARGYELEALLKEADISADLYSSEHAYVHADQLATLFNLLRNTLNDECLGLTSDPAPKGHFALLVRYLNQFRSLRDVLRETKRFYESTRQDIKIKLEFGPQECIYSFDWDLDATDPFNFTPEFILVVWHRLFSWMIGEAVRVTSIQFKFSKPRHSFVYHHLFPQADVRFDQPIYSMAIDSEQLSSLVVRSVEEMLSFVANAPESVFLMVGNDNQASSQIHQLLLKAQRAEEAFPAFVEVADVMHLSPQTLRRRLKQEGESYQSIKNNFRRDLAIDMLRKGGFSITEVAEQLGFSETASFNRAFKQWTGLTPNAYREKD